MNHHLKLFVALAASLALVEAADNTKCDSSVIQCLKDINGGKFPVNTFDGLKVMWNHDYSIVWYSEYLVKELDLTCITTKFSILGNTDTYYKNSLDTAKITFDTSLGLDGVFTISKYQGLTMKAYAAENNGCLALYVCSPEGVTGSHITIYCPTKKLSTLSADIEEAKAKLTSCGLTDGTSLCKEPCK